MLISGHERVSVDEPERNRIRVTGLIQSEAAQFDLCAGDVGGESTDERIVLSSGVSALMANPLAAVRESLT